MLESTPRKVIGSETLVLPKHWESALVNGDESGFSEEELFALNEWLAERPHLGLCVNVSKGPDFSRSHDAIEWVLPCECSTFTFELIEQD